MERRAKTPNRPSRIGRPDALSDVNIRRPARTETIMSHELSAVGWSAPEPSDTNILLGSRRPLTHLGRAFCWSIPLESSDWKRRLRVLASRCKRLPL